MVHLSLCYLAQRGFLVVGSQDGGLAPPPLPGTRGRIQSHDTYIHTAEPTNSICTIQQPTHVQLGKGVTSMTCALSW